MLQNSIEFWRRIRGMTQIDLSAKTEIDQSIISDIERGIRLADSYLDRISQALAVPSEQLLEPPPFTVGADGDIYIDRTSGRPVPGNLEELAKEEDLLKKKSRSIRRQIGRVFFLTPSQARVGIQRNKSIEMLDGAWEGVRVYVEMPCEPSQEAITLAKAEVASLADRFTREEIQKIQAEYATIFRGTTNGESSVPEDTIKNTEGLSGPDAPSDGDF